jgi:hypothetical protein
MNNETIPILNQPSIGPRAFDNLKNSGHTTF